MQFTYQTRIPINCMAKTVVKKKTVKKKPSDKKPAKKPRKKTVVTKKIIPKESEEDYSDLFAKIKDIEEKIGLLEK